MTLQSLLTIYAALLGLLVGSYLNVLIYRIPRRISTVLPRSRCPHCQAAIRPWHNVPLIGYLLLGGRCASCKAPIHWRYPLVEAINGVLFVAAAQVFGPSIEAIAAMALCALSLALAAIDLEHFLLPDKLTLTGLAIGLGLQPWLGWTSIRGALVGVALGGLLPLALSALWRLIRGVPGMGLGDVKMLAMVGAFLGWQGVVVTLVTGALLGSLVGGVGLVRGSLGAESKLPFGTFLAIGAVVALFFGPWLLEHYLAITPSLDPRFR